VQLARHLEPARGHGPLHEREQRVDGEREHDDDDSCGDHADEPVRGLVEDDLPEWLSPLEKEFIEDGLEDELLDIMGTHPFEYFAGDEKHHLTQFIRFCKLGSFVVL